MKAKYVMSFPGVVLHSNFFKLTKILIVLFKIQDLDAILIFQSQLIIPISPKVKNNILRKYHLLLRAFTGNLHFHFVIYYLGEEMTTSLIIPTHGIPIAVSQIAERRKEGQCPFSY